MWEKLYGGSVVAETISPRWRPPRNGLVIICTIVGSWLATRALTHEPASTLFGPPTRKQTSMYRRPRLRLRRFPFRRRWWGRAVEFSTRDYFIRYTVGHRINYLYGYTLKCIKYFKYSRTRSLTRHARFAKESIIVATSIGDLIRIKDENVKFNDVVGCARQWFTLTSRSAAGTHS